MYPRSLSRSNYSESRSKLIFTDPDLDLIFQCMDLNPDLDLIFSLSMDMYMELL